eukprot:5417796-Amphidinium_carterae.2
MHQKLLNVYWNEYGWGHQTNFAAVLHHLDGVTFGLLDRSSFKYLAIVARDVSTVGDGCAF